MLKLLLISPLLAKSEGRSRAEVEEGKSRESREEEGVGVDKVGVGVDKVEEADGMYGVEVETL
jgi:hypothetical protein